MVFIFFSYTLRFPGNCRLTAATPRIFFISVSSLCISILFDAEPLTPRTEMEHGISTLKIGTQLRRPSGLCGGALQGNWVMKTTTHFAFRSPVVGRVLAYLWCALAQLHKDKTAPLSAACRRFICQNTTWGGGTKARQRWAKTRQAPVPYQYILAKPYVNFCKCISARTV